MTHPDTFDIFDELGDQKFKTILIDPPWQFSHRTGQGSPEHKRLFRYKTMSMSMLSSLPVEDYAEEDSHMYLWVPVSLMPDGLHCMKDWGFTYKTSIFWHKIRRDGGSDGSGMGFYFRNVVEVLLFGVKGNLRTLDPGRTQVNYIESRKREHSRKPDEIYPIIESCSLGPYLELFARQKRDGWVSWGNQSDMFGSNDSQFEISL